MATETLKTIDPFTNIEVVDQGIADQGATFLSDLRSLNIGDGGTNVFRADKDGIFLGGKTYATAPFKVSMAGAITASSITITGGIMRYGKTSFTDSTHDGYYFGIEGLYAGKAADATLFKFTTSSGALEFGGKVVAGTGSNIAAGYISGSITASQIGSVNASAISGSITAGQITSITAGQITGAITATYYYGSISASQISSVNASSISGSISASQISSVYASSISGSISASQIGSVYASSISGAITATYFYGNISASQIGSIYASSINIGTISSSQIGSVNAGTITAGTLNVGSGGMTAIVIARSSYDANGTIRWVGGSKVFEDASNYLGLTSTGERIYFYTGTYNLFALFQRYAQASFYTGVFSGSALNVGNTSSTADARFTGRIKLYQTGENQYIDATSQVNRFWAYDQHEFYRLGSITAIIDSNFWTNGNVYGTAKYFNIAHPDGSARRLQYTAQESPDVSVRLRGLAKIGTGGSCEIVPPKHYSLVTEKNGEITVNLTAMAKNQDLFIDGVVANDKVVVSGKPNTTFMYEIVAIRKGYLNAPVEINNADDVVVQKMEQATARAKMDHDEHADKVKKGRITVA